jgi:hypothetical protein
MNLNKFQDSLLENDFIKLEKDRITKNNQDSKYQIGKEQFIYIDLDSVDESMTSSNEIASQLEFRKALENYQQINTFKKKQNRPKIHLVTTELKVVEDSIALYFNLVEQTTTDRLIKIKDKNSDSYVLVFPYTRPFKHEGDLSEIEFWVKNKFTNKYQKSRTRW